LQKTASGLSLSLHRPTIFLSGLLPPRRAEVLLSLHFWSLILFTETGLRLVCGACLLRRLGPLENPHFIFRDDWSVCLCLFSTSRMYQSEVSERLGPLLLPELAKWC